MDFERMVQAGADWFSEKALLTTLARQKPNLYEVIFWVIAQQVGLKKRRALRLFRRDSPSEEASNWEKKRQDKRPRKDGVF